jgi:hypothetical protein
MENRDIYSLVAALLPPLLGLGLIELYIERDVSLALVVAGIVALGILMIVIAALVDVTEASRRNPKRRRPRS